MLAHLPCTTLLNLPTSLPSILCCPIPHPRKQVTKQNLADKIAQLNAAIDDVSSQLNAKDPAKDEVAA